MTQAGSVPAVLLQAPGIDGTPGKPLTRAGQERSRHRAQLTAALVSKGSAVSPWKMQLCGCFGSEEAFRGLCGAPVFLTLIKCPSLPVRRGVKRAERGSPRLTQLCKHSLHLCSITGCFITAPDSVQDIS